MEYIDKEWEELERKAEKIEKIVRTISGWATAIFFILILEMHFPSVAPPRRGTCGRERPIVAHRGKKFSRQPLSIVD